jgi:hypothetical protein
MWASDPSRLATNRKALGDVPFLELLRTAGRAGSGLPVHAVPCRGGASVSRLEPLPLSAAVTVKQRKTLRGALRGTLVLENKERRV